MWFEWDFLEEPADRFLCGVCFQLMQHPHLPTCCGQQYICTGCVGQICKRAAQSARWQEDGEPRKPACPYCRTEGFKTTASADMESSILGLKVRCPHSDKGCDWVGKIREAQSDHLRSHCKYHPIGCPNSCGEEIQRNKVDQHLEVCPDQLVPCPFMPAGCSSKYVKRKNIPTHTKQNIHEHLQKTSKKICQVSLKYATVTKSLQSSFQSEQQLKQADVQITRLKRQISKIQKTNSALEEGLHTMQQEIDNLRETMEKSNAAFAAELKAKDDAILDLRELEAMLHEELAAVPTAPGPPHRTPPVSFILDHFEERRACDEVWVSPPFYSHEGSGYKMCLSVYPNGCGNGKNTHVSVFVQFMPGEYDEGLQWPFVGRVTIILENQHNFLSNLVLPQFQSIKGNFSYVVPLDSQNTLGYRVQVPRHKNYGSGFGCQTFILHGKLGPFLSSDTLKFTVLPIMFLPL